MSADRFEIHDHGSKLTVRDTKYGSEVSMLRVRSYSRELTVMAGAIRQQARDLDQLRTDLAAAVAERDRLTRSIEDDFSGWRAVERRWKLRAEQAESRLAAIEAAPTVAVVCSSECFGAFVQQRFFGSELPNIGTDLIARPAKD